MAKTRFVADPRDVTPRGPKRLSPLPFRESPLAAMPVEYLTPKIEDRALEVQLLLADRGQHRGPSIRDLVIAATAELSGLTILHVDKDFDTITAIAGQPTTRLAYTSPRGPE